MVLIAEQHRQRAADPRFVDQLRLSSRRRESVVPL
jgi:hypothetical protein